MPRAGYDNLWCVSPLARTGTTRSISLHVDFAALDGCTEGLIADLAEGSWRACSPRISLPPHFTPIGSKRCSWPPLYRTRPPARSGLW
jgi:hypothetical protein